MGCTDIKTILTYTDDFAKRNNNRQIANFETDSAITYLIIVISEAYKLFIRSSLRIVTDVGV